MKACYPTLPCFRLSFFLSFLPFFSDVVFCHCCNGVCSGKLGNFIKKSWDTVRVKKRKLPVGQILPWIKHQDFRSKIPTIDWCCALRTCLLSVAECYLSLRVRALEDSVPACARVLGIMDGRGPIKRPSTHARRSLDVVDGKRAERCLGRAGAAPGEGKAKAHLPPDRFLAPGLT